MNACDARDLSTNAIAEGDYDSAQLKAADVFGFLLFTLVVLANVLQLPQAIEYAAVLLLAFVAIPSFIEFRHEIEWLDIRYLLTLFFVPQVLLYAYSWILVLFTDNPVSFPGTNITGFSPVILAFSLLMIFRRNAIKVTMAVFGVALFAMVIRVLLIHGIDGLFESLHNILVYAGSDSTGNTQNYFEVHDMTFAAGLLLIYVIVGKGFDGKKASSAVFFLLIFLIGFKRIGVAALLVALLAALFFSLAGRWRHAVSLVGILIVSVSIGFVYLVLSGKALEMLQAYNLMGREYYWAVASRYASFDPFYLGIGRNSVTHLFQGELAYLKVGGIHSDILKMYLEAGFVLFCLWLIYLALFMPNRIRTRFNDVNLVALFMTLLVYLFVLYATDNVENYLITQVSLILVVTHEAVFARNRCLL